MDALAEKGLDHYVWDENDPLNDVLSIRRIPHARYVPYRL
jgi:hypothetical protein